MNRIKAMRELPYPEVEVDMPSMRDVRCLMEDYGGCESETTAVMTYAYQAYVTESLGDEWHDLFESLAVVEMRHHELLGESIVLLGGTPIIGGNKMFWNGACVNYERNLCKMIEADITSERKAIMCYERTKQCLENYSIRELIERIIKDEELHIEILQDALKRAKSDCLCDK